jgi:hypothetical protein
MRTLTWVYCFILVAKRERRKSAGFGWMDGCGEF